MRNKLAKKLRKEAKAIAVDLQETEYGIKASETYRKYFVTGLNALGEEIKKVYEVVTIRLKPCRRLAYKKLKKLQKVRDRSPKE